MSEDFLIAVFLPTACNHQHNGCFSFLIICWIRQCSDKRCLIGCICKRHFFCLIRKWFHWILRTLQCFFATLQRQRKCRPLHKRSDNLVTFQSALIAKTQLFKADTNRIYRTIIALYRYIYGSLVWTVERTNRISRSLMRHMQHESQCLRPDIQLACPHTIHGMLG